MCPQTGDAALDADGIPVSCAVASADHGVHGSRVSCGDFCRVSLISRRSIVTNLFVQIKSVDSIAIPGVV